MTGEGGCSSAKCTTRMPGRSAVPPGTRGCSAPRRRSARSRGPAAHGRRRPGRSQPRRPLRAFIRRGARCRAVRARSAGTRCFRPPRAARRMSPTAIGHTGFTGTSLWIDPERDLYVVLLTNRVHPRGTNNAMRALRPAFHDAVSVAALTAVRTARLRAETYEPPHVPRRASSAVGPAAAWRRRRRLISCNNAAVMALTMLGLAVIAAYFLRSLAIGLFYYRRAAREHGRVSSWRAAIVPWWLAGTSMVATTFAADTPLAVTDMVARNGVAGNWLWWSMLPSGMLTVFFFARLWRRAEVMTDVEFAELRYSGRPAAFLRGFRAAVPGPPDQLIIMGWVNLGMAKILARDARPRRNGSALGAAACGITFLYTILSGLWGVARDRRRAVRARDGQARSRSPCFASARSAASTHCRQARRAPFGRRRRATVRPAARSRSGPPVPPSGCFRRSRSCVCLGVNWWASLVSRRGAGRRRLRRAAHASPAENERNRRAGDALVQRRALRAPAVAVDHRPRSARSRCTAARSGDRPRQIRHQLRADDDRLPARRRCAG